MTVSEDWLSIVSRFLGGREIGHQYVQMPRVLTQDKRGHFSKDGLNPSRLTVLARPTVHSLPPILSQSFEGREFEAAHTNIRFIQSHQICSPAFPILSVLQFSAAHSLDAG